MYCLDTNIIIEILRNNLDLVDKVERISGSGGIFITTITLCELYKGAYLSSKRDFDIRLIEDFLSEVDVVGFDIDACKEFGQLYVNLKNLGGMVPEADLMIAAIAKSNELVLITRDKKHFEKIGIKVEVW